MRNSLQKVSCAIIYLFFTLSACSRYNLMPCTSIIFILKKHVLLDSRVSLKNIIIMRKSEEKMQSHACFFIEGFFYLFALINILHLPLGYFLDGKLLYPVHGNLKLKALNFSFSHWAFLKLKLEICKIYEISSSLRR